MATTTTQISPPIQNFYVSTHCTEASLTIRLCFPGNTTLRDVRRLASARLAMHLQRTHHPSNGLDLDHSAVILASDENGFMAYSEDDDTLLADIDSKRDGVHAIVTFKRSSLAVDVDSSSLSVSEHPTYLTDAPVSSCDVRMDEMKTMVERLERQFQLEKAEREKQDVERESLKNEVKDIRAMLAVEREERNDQLNEIVERIETVEDWAVCQNSSSLDRIRFRILLDAGQKKLAHEAGLVKPNDISSPSMIWRTTLDGKKGPARLSDSERLSNARRLLAGSPSGEVQILLRNDDAMRLLTQRRFHIHD